MEAFKVRKNVHTRTNLNRISELVIALKSYTCCIRLTCDTGRGA